MALARTGALCAALTVAACGESDGGATTNPDAGVPDAGDAGDAGSPPVLTPRAIPGFASDVLLFEDTIRHGAAVPPLVYRVEGEPASVVRTPAAGGGAMRLGGAVAVVHAAQLRRATLRASVKLQAGELDLAVAHNGLFDREGAANPNPGVALRIRTEDLAIVRLDGGEVLATIPVVLTRAESQSLAIAWDVAERSVRVEVGGSAYQLDGVDLPPGGFAVRGASNAVDAEVSALSLVWQDPRPIVLYNQYSGVYDTAGNAMRTLPAPALPPGMTAYVTVSIDLVRERSLIAFGDDTFAATPATIQGYGVRTLATGALDVLGPTVDGCLPMQGGGGLDGIGLHASPPTQSMYWIDWNAYDTGDVGGMCTLAKAATGDFTTNPPSPFVAWADPASALDGSIARYVRLDESWRGVTHFFAHPALAPFVAFTDVSVDEHSNTHVSHTGPAGFPTQLAVRDRDRAYFEEWSYVDFWLPGGGSNLHTRNRGYNLFSGALDWSGPDNPWQQDAAAFTDWANMAPSLTTPGAAIAPRFRFDPTAVGADRVTLLSADHLAVTEQGGFSPISSLATTPGNAAAMLYPILLAP